MKLGRNDPCYCGSGKKFKRCHGDGRTDLLNDQTAKEVVRTFSLQERNDILLGAIADIFGFNKGKDLSDVKKNISGEQIKDLYKIYGSLWRYDTDIYSLLPTPSNELCALYLGEVHPQRIIQNVIRFSLYTDKIYIINPFINPWIHKPDFNPINKPDEFKSDTLKLIVFITLLEPWIRKGMVELIPDPGDFNLQLKYAIYNSALERTKGWKPSERDLKEEEPYALEEFERLHSSLPPSILARNIKTFRNDIDDKTLKEMIEYIKRKRQEDPLALEQDLPVDKITGQFNLMRSGANLEMALYISQLTGAFPYTHIPRRWEELLTASHELSDTAKVWSPLTKAFQELDFNFLNGVDPEFASRIREEGRLEGFRSYLRKLWNTIGGIPDINKIESLSRDFSDELKDEYNKAKVEWEGINKDLVTWGLGTVAGMIGDIHSVITGNLNIGIPSTGFSLYTVSKLLNTYVNKRKFRANVPMSVFVDLSKHFKKK